MEDSQPLRRSTRNSVVMKKEELTPRKSKVSTPVKVEPSTPSRRTRASSATPKKNLIEAMNTPKKTLPVLNEEENPASTRTPSRKTKEVSPKTPSRRRLVRESVSTPRSTKKTVDTSDEINVTVGRPLTRAKRKTMGEIQVAEVIKTALESDKIVSNKKDKSESDKKVVQNKKDKSTITSNNDDKTDKSPVNKNEKLDESFSAMVPRVVITDIKKELSKERRNSEKNVEENECGVFTTKSPVRAEDIAINSPRKVPANCKSSSEASLNTDSEYIKSRMMESGNSINSVESTDISLIKNTDITSADKENSNVSIDTDLVPDIVASPQKVNNSTNDNETTNVVTTSPQKMTNAKNNEISNVVTTSPQKMTNLKNNEISNVATSPQKMTNSEDKEISNIVTASPQNITNSKDNEISNIVTASPHKMTNLNDNEVSNVPTFPQKITDSKDNETSNVVTASPPKVIDTLSIVPNIVITCPSPKKIGIPNIVISLPSSQKDYDENEKNSSTTATNVKDKDIEEPSKPETVPSVKVDNEIANTPENSKFNAEENIDKKSCIEEMDENNKTIIQSDVDKVIPSDFQNKETEEDDKTSPIDVQSSKEVDVKNVLSNENNSVQAVMEVLPTEVPQTVEKTDTDVEMTQLDNKELNKTFDNVKLEENTSDSVECTIANDTTKSDSIEPVSEVLTSKTDISDENETVTKDDVMPIEDEDNKEEMNESKSINPADVSLKLDTSILNESVDDKNPAEVDTATSCISAANEPTMDVENEKCNKDDKLSVGVVSPSSAENILSSPKQNLSSEVLDKDEKLKEIPNDVSMVQNNTEEDELLKETTDKTSPVKSNNASSPKPAGSAENKPIVEKESDEELVEGALGMVHDDDASSPLYFMRCGCEMSDDSGDSGIHNTNDENVFYFKMSYKCKKHIDEHHEESLHRNVPLKDDKKKDDGLVNIAGSSGDDTLKEGENESGTSDVKLSPRKSDDCVKNDSNTASVIEDKKEILNENFPKSSESTEDSNSQITGLDAILMSPKDFLNSDDENNVDCEKVEDNQSKKESSEEKLNTEPSLSENQDSMNCNVSLSNNDPSSENRSIKVDEKENDSEVNDLSAKSTVDEVESNVSTSILCDEKNGVIPVVSKTPDEVKDTCEDLEKEEVSLQKRSEERNNESKNSDKDIEISENKSESPNKNDSEKTKSVEESESEVSKTESNVQDSLHCSQSIGSPFIDVENSSESDSESSEVDVVGIDINSEPVKKNTKYIKNKRKNVRRKYDSETESSQSELSNSPPSNAATEGSSDGPLTGKDFIEFECEEGEETSEDDSFIVSSEDGTESSSSDTPSFNKKLQSKRKRTIDSESSDTCNYIDSVQRLFDSSIDDGKPDSPMKNKKQKLEKVSSINKKNKKPKSLLKSKHKIVETEEKRNRNKSKTEIKVNKEPSKTGMFIVSSISQQYEEPKLSRNTSKRSSKLRMEQKKSEISMCVPKGFNIIRDAGEGAVDDAALRGFVVTCDDSHLVTKKPRKAVSSSELISRKKNIKEGKKIKKTVKKPISSESKWNSKSETVSPFVVTLLLPFSMTSKSVSSVLTDLGLSDVSSIKFSKPKIAVVEFSNKESFKQILALYGELKINDKPIYVLEGGSL